jgi:hypothetical protein
MIGTGLIFAAGIGVLGSAIGAIALLAGELSGRELLRMVGRVSVVSFIVGVAFAGVLALTARGRSFDRLTLRFVTALGAGVGLLYFLAISFNGIGVWSPRTAVANLVVLVLLGGGLAGGTLLVARRARHTLPLDSDSERLGQGGIEVAPTRPRSETARR